MRRRNYILICLPFVIVGIAIAMHGLLRLRQSRHSLAWPVVLGDVVTADVEETKGIDGEQKFTPIIRYSYRVDGMYYESDQYTYGVNGRQEAGEAQGLVDSFKDRVSINVYYNPENPAQAVLQPGDSRGLGVIMGTGGVFIFLGLLALARGFLFTSTF